MLDHISPSQISTFFKCGEQWRRRYIDKEIIPPGFAAARGSSLHKAAEVNHRQKIGSRVDLSSSDIKCLAAESFDQRVKGGVYLPKEDIGSRARLEGEAKDETVSCADVYARELAPKIQPMLVEWRSAKKILIPKTAIEIVTILDVFTEEGWLLDIKSATKSKTQTDADDDLGLTARAIVLELEGQPITKISLETMVALKGGGKAQSLETRRDDREKNRFLKLAAAMIKAINAGNFLPANGGWACDPKWCGYSVTCPYSKFGG